MNLARDLLDKKVVDRHGREMGRVDGVILEVGDAGMPRVIAIELGPSVVAHRVSPFLGRWVEALEHALNIDVGRPLRIPLDAVLDITEQVKVDLAFGETAAATVEKRLRAIASAIPGA